ncbi:hypothetical protein SAMN04515666_101363 [Bosea lupini]|uniref:Uncharacterized protein n=2 Tax=Bosea lupini TaxID=1036779 RepID=A0A1H7GJT1_9HYPH|nr:hypothetical protein SAMN04515666_101363 [Bosea lupini]
MRVASDGKFLDRLVPSLISVLLGIGVALGGQALGFWADTRAADERTAQAITRLERRLDAVEVEAKDARKAAADDRAKTVEIAGDVRNLVRSNARIETLLDRVLIQPLPRAP